MFCSGCGQPLQANETYCPQCGRAAMQPPPPTPAAAGYELSRYAQKVHVLSIIWFAWAVLSLIFGIAGLAFSRAFFMGGFGPWGDMRSFGHGPEMISWPGLLHIFWIALIVRFALLALAAWGLWRRTGWGRILAIVVAILSLLRFPIGTALGVVTLIFLLGGRNSFLYEQLQRAGAPSATPDGQ
jgi:hypothetical protein